MKPNSFMKILALHIFVCTGFILRSQPGTTVVNTNAINTDSKDQQYVKLQTPNGKITSTGVNQGRLYIDKDVMIDNTPNVVTSNPVNLPAHDKNLPVGTISGVPSVDLNGASNYAIKLDLPPGTNAMIPDVSINYNSNSGDNQLGLGWSINGISAIRREHQTLFHDNNVSQFSPSCNTYWSSNLNTSTCPLYLDGIKLVCDQSTTNAFFKESDDFSKVTYNSASSYFLVETKSGLKMEYGRNSPSNNSLRKIVSNTYDYAWYLNKVYDNYGNYIEYYYHNVNNEIAIKEIKYTGNSVSGQAPYNSIKFYYNKRTDERTKYFYEDIVKQGLQLREIEIFSEGQTVSRYLFQYSFEDFNYLNSITKVSSNNENFNPTCFIYGNAAGPKLIQTGAQLTNGSTNFSPTQDYVTADFNNDGKTDILELHILGIPDPNNGFKTYDEWRLFLNTNNGLNFQLQQTTTLPQFHYASAFSGSFSYLHGINPNANGIEIGDINGDGYMDLVYAEATNQSIAAIAAYTYNPVTNLLSPITLPTGQTSSCQGGNKFNFRVPTGGSFNSLNNMDLQSGASGNTSMCLGDFNGDGKSELLTFYRDKGTSSEINIFFFSRFLDANTAAFHNVGELYDINIPQSSLQFQVKMLNGADKTLNDYSGFSAADYNGDGKTDLLGYRDVGTNARFVVIDVSLMRYSGDQTNNCFITFKEIAEYAVASSMYPVDHASSGDFNGDGYLDFIQHPYLTGLQSGISFGTGKILSQLQNCNNIGLRGLKKKFMALDVNADGISDLVKIETYSNLDVTAEVILGQNLTKGILYENYGTIGVAPAPDATNICGMPPNKDYLHPLCDYDYDGAAAANCFNPNTDPDDLFDSDPSKIPFYSVGDFDGDGYNDIIYRKGCTNGPFFQIIYFKHKYQNKFITKTVDGMNKRTDFTYSTIAKNNYTKSSTIFSYPTIRVNFPFNIVTAITFTNGANLNGSYTSETVNYFYEDLLVNKHGKGFLGFKKVVSADALTNKTLEQTFIVDPNFFVKLPYQKKMYSAAQNLNTETQSYTIINKNQPGILNITLRKRYEVRLSSKSNLNVVRNITTNSTYLYDANGNITQDFTSIVGKKQTVIDYTNYVNAGSWLPNMPQTVTTQNSYAGQTPFQVKTINLVYDVSKGHVNTQITEPSQLKSVVTSKTYDANTGVLIQSSISAPNDPTNPGQIITTLSYDPKFRLVVQEVSPLGYVKHIDYNFKFGVPVKTTAADGLVTQMQYDYFGRLKKTIDPNGNAINQDTYWYTTNNVQTGDPKPVNADLTSYFTEIKSTGNPTTRNYYDINDRVIKTDLEGFSGNISNLKDYDIYGNVKKEFGPFFVPPPPSATMLIKTNNYGTVLNELLSTNLSDGNINNTTNYAYNYITATGDMIITTTDPSGKITTQKLDKADKLIEATDNGGTLEYNYYSNEKLKETKLNGTVIKTLVYDAFDFLYQEIEKNSGTKQFNYNAYGQKTSYLDAKGTTCTYVYDGLGRLITETIGPDTYNYTYKNNGNGKGQIDNILLSNNTQFIYTYDNYGRVIKSDEKINGITYSNQFFYDNLNRVIKQIYPNNFTIKRSYNNLGYPLSINVDGTNEQLWKADELDHLGNYTKITRGNGIQSVHSYNNINIPQSFIAGNKQNLIFDIDNQTGNLKKITDNIKGNVEEYQYDNLDRLTQTKLNNINPLTIGYDNKGNITNKFDAGNYVYDSQKHNQVKDVGNSNNIISNIQQDITYTLFDKTKHITEGPNEIEITYGPTKDRMQTEFILNGNSFMRRLYLNNCQIELDNSSTILQTVNYINAPSGICAIQVEQGVSKNIYYPYYDHLGSILTVTNKFGVIVAEQNFDAWGRRRNANTWAYNSLNVLPSWLSRGYTGHEMLESFNLINMNGRMYDPILGRMLSVDPILQNEKSTQGYNKYSYCLNNPLKYTDPSGYATVAGIGGAALNTFWGSSGPGGSFVSGMSSIGSFFSPSSYGTVNDGGGSAIWKDAFDGNISTGPGTIKTKTGGLNASHESAESEEKDARESLAGQHLYFIATIEASNVHHEWYTTSSMAARNYSGPKDFKKLLKDAEKEVIAWVYAYRVQDLGAENKYDNLYNIKGQLKFAGENVHYMPYGGGITYPGVGIYIDFSAERGRSKDATIQLLRHEYGHILQAKKYGILGFYGAIAPASLNSATIHDFDGHNHFWTETNANQLSSEWFKDAYNIKSIPWDYIRNPVN
ncbi:MAG: VCBS repeat-containing protein [Bacteroidia bacterium]|nr:VCBS repeat-containing protein [Bacteroidia bacterium]